MAGSSLCPSGSGVGPDPLSSIGSQLLLELLVLGYRDQHLTSLAADLPSGCFVMGWELFALKGVECAINGACFYFEGRGRCARAHIWGSEDSFQDGS